MIRERAGARKRCSTGLAWRVVSRLTGSLGLAEGGGASHRGARPQGVPQGAYPGLSGHEPPAAHPLRHSVQHVFSSIVGGPEATGASS